MRDASAADELTAYVEEAVTGTLPGDLEGVIVAIYESRGEVADCDASAWLELRKRRP